MMRALRLFWTGEITQKNVLTEVRIGARALHRFYRLGLVLVLLFLPWEMMLPAPDRLEGVRLVIRLVLVMSLIASMELTRRTRVRLGGALMSFFLVSLVISEMVHFGGINVFACVMCVPMLLLAFVHARREVFISACVSGALVIGVHVWLTWFSTNPGPGSIYEPLSALVTFVLMQLASSFIVYLSARHASLNIMRLERGREEFDMAVQHEELRRVDAERARMQADLAMRAKSRFLANMSHELRTPLNAILGYSEMIEEELDDHPELAELCAEDVQRVKRAGRHLLDVINDILDLSRLEVERMPFDARRISARDLMDHARAYMAQRLGSEGASRMTWGDAPGTLHVWGDIERLSQLFVLGVLMLESAGHISCEEEGDDLCVAFVPSNSMSGSSTHALIELRRLLQDALIEKLDVSCVMAPERFLMRVPRQRADDVGEV